MSKVQPNHNRRIMQTGLGQPESLCRKHRMKLGRFQGKLGRLGWGKRSKKLATLWELLLSGCVDICIINTYINITVGRKGGGYHGVKRSQQKKRMYWTEERILLGILIYYLSHWGPGFVGLRNGHNTHTLRAFLFWRSQCCLGLGGTGGWEGESQLRVRSTWFPRG